MVSKLDVKSEEDFLMGLQVSYICFVAVETTHAVVYAYKFNVARAWFAYLHANLLKLILGLLGSLLATFSVCAASI